MRRPTEFERYFKSTGRPVYGGEFKIGRLPSWAPDNTGRRAVKAPASNEWLLSIAGGFNLSLARPSGLFRCAGCCFAAQQRRAALLAFVSVETIAPMDV